MNIVLISNTTPQFIGNTDGHSSTRELLKQSHNARHTTIRIVARGVAGNEVSIYCFDSQNRFDKFAARNPDMVFSDVAMDI